MSNSAERRAFDAVEETCPRVNDAREGVAEMIEKITNQIDSYEKVECDARDNLRRGIVEAYEEVERRDGKVNELEAWVEELEWSLDQSKSEVDDLTQRLERAERMLEPEPAVVGEQ